MLNYCYVYRLYVLATKVYLLFLSLTRYIALVFCFLYFDPVQAKSVEIHDLFHPVVESQAKMITINGHALLKERPC